MIIDKRIWREDYRLVRKTLKGDIGAWEILYEKYYKLVHGYVRKKIWRRFKGYISSDDITAEAFTISYEKLSLFKGRSKYSTWVCEIAKALLADEYKKYAEHGELPIHLHLIHSKYALPERIAIEKDWKTCIHIAFASLSSFQRNLLKKRAFRRLNEIEIAERYGLDVFFVQRQLYIARRTLKKRFLYLYKNQRRFWY